MIKDVSFDSSLKSNVHWAALFSHAFKRGDNNLKSGPFGCGFMEENKGPQSSGVFRKIEMLLALILSMIICTSVRGLDPCSGSSLFLLILY